ncbi:MAG TPA: hypothetical protein PK325_10935 [Cyclobacteriaceae bacterium]|nr:hypothetical protein [Cyclobacteriaceae bacterium]HMV08787.1 hypothetical protein [Cyclobacteriaceae bacterium]HMV91325.1 hypothetical protein [Cyclobacteriaceae bacterium]HMW99933.1 hypothetical protein [Cyclobacteriaceae bacterium]HMX49204.1 hypothetical protein [Cyclobacteriaceae bacterium]
MRPWFLSIFVFLITAGVLSGCMRQMMEISKAATIKAVQPEFEQVDFQELMKRYMSKDVSSSDDIEGIYSVSIVVEKKNKPLFSSEEQQRVVERKENYATVAIVRDHTSGREYIEISLDKEKQSSYPVRGEFAPMNDRNIMIYKHFEPKGKSFTYTFSFDKDRDMLEGIRTEVNGKTEFTYKMTYLKMQPKRNTAGSGY